MEKRRFFGEPSSEGSFATLGKIFKGIPEAFLGICGWSLVVLFMALLLVEAAVKSFGIAGIYMIGFALLGAAAEVLTILWIGKRLLDREHCLRVDWVPTDVALALMLVWCGLSTVFSSDPMVAYVGSDYRREGLSTYLIYAALYFCCRRIRQENWTRCFAWFLCMTGTLLSVWSLFYASSLGKLAEQKLGYFTVFTYSACGVFDNLNHYAYFLTMSMMAAAGIFLVSSAGAQKILALIAYAVQSYMMVQNGSLGGYVAVVIGLLFLLVMSIVRKEGCIGAAVLLLAIHFVMTIVSSYVGYDIIMDAQHVATELEQGVIAESNTLVRFYMWKQALGYIARRPLLGFGPDGSGVLEFGCEPVLNDRPHNEYLQYAVFFGIPGALMYLSALGTLFVRCIRKIKQLSVVGLILGGMVFAYCASAFVGNSMYYTTVYFVMILALLVNESTRDVRK